MHREAFGDAVAELPAEQQTGGADATASVSVGTKGHYAPARTHRILVASDHLLLGAAHLPEDLLLDLQTRRAKAEA